MRPISGIQSIFFPVVFLLLLSGCATVDSEFADPRDPIEGLNRTMFSFNDELDRAVFKPLSQFYKKVTPAPMDTGISNFFNNLGDVVSTVNSSLQFKPEKTLNHFWRVVFNSTIGIGGLLDVATHMDLPRQSEDFGQTLGVWGVGSGYYLVLPLFGPSSTRDVVGRVADSLANPLTYVTDNTLRFGLQGLNILDTRADLLSASKVLDEAALDPYTFTRDAYLQRRLHAVHDGNPPPQEDSW